MDPKLQAYVALVTTAMTIGTDLVALIKTHAQQNLTPAEYADLESKWQIDIDESATNAGIPLSDVLADPTQA